MLADAAYIPYFVWSRSMSFCLAITLRLYVSDRVPRRLEEASTVPLHRRHTQTAGGQDYFILQQSWMTLPSIERSARGRRAAFGTPILLLSCLPKPRSKINHLHMLAALTFAGAAVLSSTTTHLQPPTTATRRRPGGARPFGLAAPTLWLCLPKTRSKMVDNSPCLLCNPTQCSILSCASSLSQNGDRKTKWKCYIILIWCLYFKKDVTNTQSNITDLIRNKIQKNWQKWKTNKGL